MKLIILNNDLCLTNDSGENIIKRHKPSTRILEFKQLDTGSIIVREDTYNYDNIKSNIYCLNDNLEMIWVSDQPIDSDTFPNEILWNKELNEFGKSWDNFVLVNPNTLTCSSSKGITVTIDYRSGEILKSIFTK